VTQSGDEPSAELQHSSWALVLMHGGGAGTTGSLSGGPDASQAARNRRFKPVKPLGHSSCYYPGTTPSHPISSIGPSSLVNPSFLQPAYPYSVQPSWACWPH
jgi:hypothetical protein